MKNLAFTILVVFLFSCGDKKIEQFTISGKNTELIGDTIFLKKFKHFDYLDENYILDTCVVNALGEFTFKIKPNYPKLVSITKHNKPPNTYQVFKDTPEIFYYSFCANFLAETPTLYVDNNTNYEIKHWDSKLNDTSIIYDNSKLNVLRKYYRSADYRIGYVDNDRKFLNISKEKALRNVIKIKDSFLREYSLNIDFNQDSFENYLKTEIELGSINDFLIWYKRQTENDTKTDFYKELMETYNSGKWNSNSVEYYKFTEQYITYKLNLKYEKKANYYNPGIDKIEFAKKYARDNIKELYVKNIKILTSINEKAPQQ